MLKIIERLRGKSHSAKKRIAFLTAVSVAGFIFVIWLSVIYPNFKEGEEKENKASKYEVTPFSAFSETISNSFVTMGAELTSFGEGLGIGKPETYVNDENSEIEVSTTASSTIRVTEEEY